MKTMIFAMAIVATLGAAASCDNELVTYTAGDVRVSIRAGAAWLHDFPLFLGIKKKNPPQIAIWAEDLSGNYLSTLYATHKIATATWMANGGDPRKEALPVWSHARGGQPTKQAPMVDGISGATPQADFDVKLRPMGDLRQFVMKIEVNHSRDWNDAYPENAAKGDAGYSAESGQPALVYAARIDLDSPQTTYTARLTGHSSADGTDGNIAPDTSSLTSALEIVKRITIEIE